MNVNVCLKINSLTMLIKRYSMILWIESLKKNSEIVLTLMMNNYSIKYCLLISNVKMKSMNMENSFKKHHLYMKHVLILKAFERLSI